MEKNKENPSVIPPVSSCNHAPILGSLSVDSLGNSTQKPHENHPKTEANDAKNTWKMPEKGQKNARQALKIPEKIPGKYGEEVRTYVEGVITGKIPENEYGRKGVERFIRDFSDERYVFNAKEADFCIDVIQRTICHQQGERLDGTALRGTPFFLMPFHKYIVYGMLGITRRNTRVKKYNEALIFMPRKNVKTSFTAGLSFALALLYSASGSKVYVVAGSLKQTMETFNFLKYNIRNMKEEKTKGGRGHFVIKDNNQEHSICGQIGGGMVEIHALPSNPDAQDSFNCNVVIADEMHAYKKAKQYELLKDATSAYTNSMVIGISSAGDIQNGFLENKVRYCKKVLDGQVENESYFIFLREADESTDENGNKYLDYTNPEIHRRSNPAYGVAIRPEKMTSDALMAQNDPQLRKEFFNKRLNVFTQSINTYFDMERVRLSDDKYDFTIEECLKWPISWYGGVDLSKVNDMTGACIYGRYKGVDICISHAFIPASQVNAKQDEDHIPVEFWREQGWLSVCNSDVIESEDVMEWFVRMRKRGFKIRNVGFDRRFSKEFVTKMKNKGFKMIDSPQRYVEKTEAFREIEKKITTKNFYYFHNLAYEYCIANVKAIEDETEFVKFGKIAPKQRIDLFDCSTIACRMLLIDQEKQLKAKSLIDA